MKQALLSIGAALALAAAALPSPASAQVKAGGGGGGAHISGGGGGAHISGGGGGGARIGGGGVVRSAPSSAFAASPSGQRLVQGGITAGGKRFVQGGGNFVQGGGNVRGRHFVGRRHLRGAGFAIYGAAPYYDDYAYSDCYQLRLIAGVWQRVNVCDYDSDY